MPAEWVFRLRDQVSGPAAGIDRQLRQVTGALKLMDIQAKQSHLGIPRLIDPLKRQRLELQLQRDKLMQSKRALEDHTRATTTNARSVSDSLLRFGASLYILDFAKRAFSAVGRAASFMGDQIQDAVSTQQRGSFGLRATLGGAAGSSFFSQLSGQAQRFGRPVGELVGMGQSFVQAGASPAASMEWIKRIQDVRARSGDAAAGTFQGAVQQMLTSPEFSSGNLQAFGGLFGMNKTYGAFANALGIRTDTDPRVTRRVVDSTLGRGIVSGPQAQSIMGQFMQGQMGAPGALGGQFAAGTLPGAVGRVQTSLERLWGSLSQSKGLKMLQDVLQNLAATLGSREVRKSLTDLANTLGAALKPLTGPDGKKSMQDFFTSMAASVEEVMPGVKAIAGFIGMMAGAGLKSLRGLGYLSDFGGDVAGMVTGSLQKGDESEATRRFLKGFFGDSTLPDGSTRRPTAAQRAAFNAAINVNVDARGATKEDADAIGSKLEETMNNSIHRLLERIQTEQGGIPQ